MRKVAEREMAKAAGERFYFTGKPCRNGHMSKRRTESGTCAMCDSAKTLRYMDRTPEHPSRVAARARGARHYQTGKPCKHGHDQRLVSNGQCLPCSVRKSKKWKIETGYDEAAYKRKYRARFPHKQVEIDRRYRANHPEKVKGNLREWKGRNIDHVRAMAIVYQANRRARKKANGGLFTLQDVERIYARQNGICAACPSTENLELDHVLPVILGGSSDPSNLQLLCLPCNRSKGGKHPDLWNKQLATKRPRPLSPKAGR